METKKKSELAVVMKSKELCGYIMTVTQKSPYLAGDFIITREGAITKLPATRTALLPCFCLA